MAFRVKQTEFYPFRLRGIPCLLVVFLAALIAGGCRSTVREKTPSLKRFAYSEPKWGAVFSILLYAPDEKTANEAAAAAFARFDELGAIFNDYDGTSEVSRLSAATRGGPLKTPVPVSDDLYRVLEASVDAAKRSDGAFDVTVGPYSRLWRRSRDLRSLPSEERLEKTRKSVGIQHVRLDPRAKTVQLLAPDMRLDFGGIVTGYANDLVIELLRRRGIKHALIDAAGDLIASEAPPGTDGWRVALQPAGTDKTPASEYLLLKNAAASTSGDTYRFVEINGKRYSHIVDPRTGLGLTTRIGATVIAKDGITADWLDTAIPVMGGEKGTALVDSIPGAAARITVLSDDGIKQRVYDSSRFAAFLTAPPHGSPNINTENDFHAGQPKRNQ